METWAEGCSCHGTVTDISGPTRHLRVSMFQQAFNQPTCPLRGRRALSSLVGTSTRSWMP
eukprot:2428901-Prorocentrum_lima.AAC.1